MNDNLQPSDLICSADLDKCTAHAPQNVAPWPCEVFFTPIRLCIFVGESGATPKAPNFGDAPKLRLSLRRPTARNACAPAGNLHGKATL
ncbi:uncharacterized protein CC84DRAFT_218000 [Paraphaeosphaeria sporulosa]|uniref:Uncharacterized protein n=1 Tax=Paraphaeosphaeria sporulosa TaxID=1460663 RepID=A0A177C1V0_9PLEO|nr:uncharacterized protein CC84DRAFT_218000 [Paraphaeosphaeria sporulosa]OAG01764.1 hypothetical protein CC84DRAFT_218000 [Paraphaeosphaeria sporulosa]